MIPKTAQGWRKGSKILKSFYGRHGQGSEGDDLNGDPRKGEWTDRDTNHGRWGRPSEEFPRERLRQGEPCVPLSKDQTVEKIPNNKRKMARTHYNVRESTNLNNRKGNHTPEGTKEPKGGERASGKKEGVGVTIHSVHKSAKVSEKPRPNEGKEVYLKCQTANFRDGDQTKDQLAGPLAGEKIKGGSSSSGHGRKSWWRLRWDGCTLVKTGLGGGRSFRLKLKRCTVIKAGLVGGAGTRES